MTRVSVAMSGGKLSRDVAIVPRNSAFLVIDVQYGFAQAGAGAYDDIDPHNIPEELDYYFGRIASHVIPNIKRLQDGARAGAVEVMFAAIESLTWDGRERGLDYKISGFLVPKGSKEAQILDEVKPVKDEIILAKSSSSVFNSTNIDYILRGLEIDHLIVAGLVTDQCIEGAVRDACDLGYLVTLVEDACGTYSEKRHLNSLEAIKGYCRIKTTDQILSEMAGAD